MEENDWIYDKKVVTDPGESPNLKAGQIISLRKLRDENAQMKRKDLKLVEVREAHPATSSPLLQGITRAPLGTKSFISADSFQEARTSVVLGKSGAVSLDLGGMRDIKTSKCKKSAKR